MEWLLLVGIALLIAIIVLRWLVLGAFGFFTWSAEHGFMGVAVYIILWGLLFPVMLIGSIHFGIYIQIIGKQ